MQSYYREEGTSIMFPPVGGCCVTAGAHDLTGWISWRLQTLALPLISGNNMSKSSSAQLGWMGLALFSMKQRSEIWEGLSFEFKVIFITTTHGVISYLSSGNLLLNLLLWVCMLWKNGKHILTWHEGLAADWWHTKVCLVKWCDELPERQNNNCFACTDLRRSRF